MSLETVSEIIDGIYASAVDPGRWPDALGRINDVIECRASVVGIVSFTEDFSLVNATAGFDDGFATRYGSNLAALSEIWGGQRQIAARPVNEPVVLSRHHPVALVRGSKQHNLLCEVLGFEVEDTLNLPLAHLGRAFGAAGFARESGEGTFEAEIYRLLRLISPHIQRSAEINRLLDAQALSTALRDGLLERLRSPVAIIDGGMRLVQANESARSILSSVAGKVPLHPTLSKAIGEVASGAANYRCARSAEWGDGKASIVHVMSLDDRSGAPLKGYAALVFAPERPAGPASIDSIGDQYHLTAAEAAVLRHLVGGKSSNDIAADLALRPSTVRTHILRIFDKFDVHHRAELVAFIHAMTSPFETNVHQMVDAASRQSQ